MLRRTRPEEPEVTLPTRRLPARLDGEPVTRVVVLDGRATFRGPLLMRRQIALLAAFLVALSLTSCGGQNEVESGGYVIYVASRDLFPPGGQDALIQGVLALRGECVVLESGESGSWVPVVWPAGTSVASTDPFALRLLSGEELALGESVSCGGGYDFPEDVAVDIPSECMGESREIAVFKVDSKLIVG